MTAGGFGATGPKAGTVHFSRIFRRHDYSHVTPRFLETCLLVEISIPLDEAILHVSIYEILIANMWSNSTVSAMQKVDYPNVLAESQTVLGIQEYLDETV
eukprot:scaffold5955_cov95-Cylindrotheca_fusiformis.AAC.1